MLYLLLLACCALVQVLGAVVIARARSKVTMIGFQLNARCTPSTCFAKDGTDLMVANDDVGTALLISG